MLFCDCNLLFGVLYEVEGNLVALKKNGTAPEAHKSDQNPFSH